MKIQEYGSYLEFYGQRFITLESIVNVLKSKEQRYINMALADLSSKLTIMAHAHRNGIYYGEIHMMLINSDVYISVVQRRRSDIIKFFEDNKYFSTPNIKFASKFTVPKNQIFTEEQLNQTGWYKLYAK